MKASTLIQHLQAAIKECGDLEVELFTDEEPGWLSVEGVLLPDESDEDRVLLLCDADTYHALTADA